MPCDPFAGILEGRVGAFYDRTFHKTHTRPGRLTEGGHVGYSMSEDTVIVAEVAPAESKPAEAQPAPAPAPAPEPEPAHEPTHEPAPVPAPVPAQESKAATAAAPVKSTIDAPEFSWL